jgi:hypothetical protein
VKYSLLNEAVALCNENENMEAFCLPIEHLTFDLTRDELCKMASLHNIHFRSDDRKPALQALFINHYCNICEHYVALFQKKHPFLTSTVEDEPFEMFPPKPLSHLQVEQIVNDFCTDTSPATFEESGCAVCGQLMINTELTLFQDSIYNLSPLIAIGVTRKEHLTNDDPVTELTGPIFDNSC